MFKRGKSKKKDVMDFEMHLEDSIFTLHEEVLEGRYRHSLYTQFQVFDSKKRNIFKAKVRDRVMHQILYNYLVSVFEPHFIADSYASRKSKGQYKALETFCYFTRLASYGRRECTVLKCDVKKYFDNIDHVVLLNLIQEKVTCTKILGLIKEILSSYHANGRSQKGIPLGNITSQIFANVYLNTLDQYVKDVLRCRFYIRYNDDIVLVFQNDENCISTRDAIRCFAKEKLLLDIPIEKTSIRKLRWGVDFLGFVFLSNGMLLRNATKQKIYAHIHTENRHAYLPILQHCNAFNLKTKIMASDRLIEEWM